MASGGICGRDADYNGFLADFTEVVPYRWLLHLLAVGYPVFGVGVPLPVPEAVEPELAGGVFPVTITIHMGMVIAGIPVFIGPWIDLSMSLLRFGSSS